MRDRTAIIGQTRNVRDCTMSANATSEVEKC